MKSGNITEKIYKRTIGLFSWCILFFFTFYALFSYCALSFTEETYFLPDNMYKNILVIVFFLTAMTVCRYFGLPRQLSAFLDANDEIYIKVKRTLFIIIFIIALLWVLSTQVVPSSDAGMLQHGVHALMLHDYSDFTSDGYFSMYPHQLGLVLFCYLFSILLGVKNYIAFQFFNIICLILFYHELCNICERAGFKRIHVLSIPLIGIIFFPLIMYCSSVYGILAGMAFSTTAIRHEIDWFNLRNTRSAILSVIFVCLALLLKKNTLIYIIGMIIYAIIKVISSKRIILIAIVPVYIAVIIMTSHVPTVIINHITGQNIGKGSSSWCWIAMGMQEAWRAPGWFNNYVEDAYINNSYSTELSSSVAKESIKERIIYFSGHKQEAVEFYTLKTASQWNNPTYQAFWLMQISGSTIYSSELIHYFISIEGEQAVTAYLKVFRLMLYFFALLGVIGLKKYDAIEAWLCPLIFVGGAIFHIFIWEAESDYTIPYIPLLIPISIIGADTITGYISSVIKKKKLIKSTSHLTYMIMSVFLSMVLYVFYSDGRVEYLTADDTNYLDYSNYYITHPLLPASGFRLYSASKPSLGLYLYTDNDIPTITLSDNPTTLYSTYTHSKSLIYSVQNSENLYIALLPEETATDYVTATSLSYEESNQSWTVVPGLENSIYILYNSNKALTHNDDGQVVLEQFEGREDQLWLVKE